MVRKISRLHWLGVGVEGGRASGVRREVFGGMKNLSLHRKTQITPFFKKNTVG